MNINDFEKELQVTDKDLSIRPNNPLPRVVEMFPDTIKLASILYRGSEVCTIPNYDIYDEPNGSYGVDLRGDGRFVKHRTRIEALNIVNETLDRIKNDTEFREQFFGTGDYSEASLRSKEVKGEVTLVEEVVADVQEIIGGTLEGPK